MQLQVLASTCPGYNLPIDDAMILIGQEANICYMKGDIQTILSEPAQKSLDRAKKTIANGHHSVADHVYYCLSFEGMPKIGAMLLNNGGVYATSEKSGRFTQMQPDPVEEKYYLEWINILKDVIMRQYPQMSEMTATKRAQENARYFISVFTPATSMGHTLNLRRINYTIGYCDNLIAMETENPFLIKLKPVLVQLRDSLMPFNVPELRDDKAYIFSFLDFDPKDPAIPELREWLMKPADAREPLDFDFLGEKKGYGFTLFARRKRQENFGESFCINSTGTFTMFAQLQRHRFMMLDEFTIPDPNNCNFFRPAFIEDPALQAKWDTEIRSLAERFPQGMMLDICSMGCVDSFIRMSLERLCGAAQYEICMWTNENLKRLISGCIETNSVGAAYDLMRLQQRGAKCQFGNYLCANPCPFGPNGAFDRLI